MGLHGKADAGQQKATDFAHIADGGLNQCWIPRRKGGEKLFKSGKDKVRPNELAVCDFRREELLDKSSEMERNIYDKCGSDTQS